MKELGDIIALNGAADTYFAECSQAQRRWLSTYVNCGDVVETSRTTGIDHLEAMLWLRQDTIFKEAFEQGRILVGYNLEGMAMKKAISEEGTDRLIIKMLEAMLPSKYLPNHNSDDDDDQNPEFQVVLDLREGDEDEYEAG